MNVRIGFHLICILNSESTDKIVECQGRTFKDDAGIKCTLGLKANLETVELYLNVENTNDAEKTLLINVTSKRHDLDLIEEDSPFDCALEIDETKQIFVKDEVVHWKLLEVPREVVVSRINVWLILRVLKYSGYGNPRFQEKSELTDVEFLVEKNRFHVSKAILLNSSSVFRSQLLADPGLTEITIDQVDSASFDTFLSELHGDRYLHSKVIDEVLALARRFDCPIVERRVEQFLMTTTKSPDDSVRDPNAIPRVEKFITREYIGHKADDNLIYMEFYRLSRKELFKHWRMLFLHIVLILVATVLFPFLVRLLFRYLYNKH